LFPVPTQTNPFKLLLLLLFGCIEYFWELIDENENPALATPTLARMTGDELSRTQLLSHRSSSI
jgi:hypothetical protein